MVRVAHTSRRSPTTGGRSAIPTTIPSSRRPRISTCPSRSIRRSSRNGPRVRGWGRGSTSSSCGCSRRSPRPTGSASSSRPCSTTACSTSSPDSRSWSSNRVVVGSATGSTASMRSTATRSSEPGCRCSTSRATTSATACGSRAIPTSGRSRRSPSGSAPTGSCGRPTSPTPITRPTTSPISTRSRPRSMRLRDGSSSAATPAGSIASGIERARPGRGGPAPQLSAPSVQSLAGAVT